MLAHARRGAALGMAAPFRLRPEPADDGQAEEIQTMLDPVHARAARPAASAGVVAGVVHVVVVLPEVHVQGLQAQHPGVGQRHLGAGAEHPADLRRPVAERIVGVHRAVGRGLAVVDVGHGIGNAGDGRAARDEQRGGAEGLPEAEARRGQPAELRHGRFAQAAGVEPVGAPVQIAEDAAELEPQRHAGGRELLPGHHAGDEPGILVVGDGAGVAPVREAVGIRQAAVQPPGAGKGPGIGPFPVRREAVAGLRRAAGQEAEQDGRHDSCAAAAGIEGGVLFHTIAYAGGRRALIVRRKTARAGGRGPFKPCYNPVAKIAIGSDDVV